MSVNFLGHACVAGARCTDPRFVFGAMLPDFATMAGVRLEGTDDPEIAAGVAFHHTTDDAFHGAPTFIELMSDARDVLEAEGVDLGPAMAVGHVGVELLLDGWLVDRPGAEARYRVALDAGRAQLDTLRFRSDPNGGRVAQLCARLCDAAVPGGYRDPDFVADRLERILSTRPRLALDAHAVERVSA